jgi:hypothetical protein
LVSPRVFKRIGINEENPHFFVLKTQDSALIYILIVQMSMDVPPDGGYGWVVVAAIFWNNAHHWGLVSVSCPSN